MSMTTELMPATEMTTRTITDIRQADTATLKQELANQLTLTAKALVYLSQIWQELAVRGVDLSDLRSGLASYLPKIASGTLEAELVVKYAGQRVLLDALSKLPREQQQEYAREGKILIVKLDENLNKHEEEVSLASLSAITVGRVFGNGRVIPPTEQYKALFLNATQGEKNRKRKEREKKARVANTIRVDEDGDLVVGTSKASVDRVVDALAVHYGINLAQIIEDNTKAFA